MNELKYPVQWKNSVKFSKGKKAEKLNHRITKAMVCAVLSENNLDYATEAELIRGGRADIYVLDWNCAIEVLHSETMRKFEKKNYGCKTIPVSTKISLNDIISMVEDIIATKGSGVDYYIKQKKRCSCGARCFQCHPLKTNNAVM